MIVNTQKINFTDLQRRLKLNKNLSNFNYRGERTLVVVSGLNSDLLSLRKVKGLIYYEERMLFFLFLLRYQQTKIIYITSKGFNTKLFDYYLSLISDDDSKIQELRSRLTHIEVDGVGIGSLTGKILKNTKAISQIKKSITNLKTAQLRCYSPGHQERKLALRLGIPLFGGKEKFDYIGTKSGGRHVFQLTGVNLIPGFQYLKNLTQLSLAMAELMKNYPYYKRIMVKLNWSSSGRGNAIFDVKGFLKDNEIEISIKSDLTQLARLIRRNFCRYISFQMPNQSCSDYLKEFSRSGGITELYISGEIKYSPSVQMFISARGTSNIISTHEQILGGLDKQKYLGCFFPSESSHRNLIIKEAKKVANWMAKKGMIGHFCLDFIVVYREDSSISKIYPIEINLRKGGTTHPFRIAYYLTSSKYHQKDGMLYCGKTPIYYLARDIIYSEDYKKYKPMELINLIYSSKISFNKNTKRGVLIYMPGMVKTYGQFGAICIGHSRQETEIYYKRLIKLLDNHVKNK